MQINVYYIFIQPIKLINWALGRKITTIDNICQLLIYYITRHFLRTQNENHAKNERIHEKFKISQFNFIRKTLLKRVKINCCTLLFSCLLSSSVSPHSHIPIVEKQLTPLSLIVYARSLFLWLQSNIKTCKRTQFSYVLRSFNFFYFATAVIHLKKFVTKVFVLSTYNVNGIG